MQNETVFKLCWKDGKIEYAIGKNIAEAFRNAGLGAGAIPALDYYDELTHEKLFNMGGDAPIMDTLLVFTNGPCYDFAKKEVPLIKKVLKMKEYLLKKLVTFQHSRPFKYLVHNANSVVIRQKIGLDGLWTNLT